MTDRSAKTKCNIQESAVTRVGFHTKGTQKSSTFSVNTAPAG